MDNGASLANIQPATRRRIPKACGACRQSKVKCDGERPCSRCQLTNKTCIFAERPREIGEARIDDLEREVQHLRQLQEAQQANQRFPQEVFNSIQPSSYLPQLSTGAQVQQLNTAPPHGQQRPSHTTSQTTTAPNDSSPALHVSTTTDTLNNVGHTHSTGSLSICGLDTPSTKRKRQHFDIYQGVVPDFVTKSLISLGQAHVYFKAFFDGCDRFIPVFDPSHDTFESIRTRSSLLFNSICTIGCAVQEERGSQASQRLNFELKKCVNVVILSQQLPCLETVQAMLVMACYSSDRSLILSLATRMALDINLPEAYEKLTTHLVTRDSDPSTGLFGPQEYVLNLMRQTRTWFGLLVLEHILRIDAGNIPGFTLKHGVRRCRFLLHHGISTILDLRLFSQVELNFIRADIHDSIDKIGNAEDEDMTEIIRNAKIDLDVWFRDWQHIIQSKMTATTEAPSLLLNLEIQKYWAETMALCKVLRSRGIDDISGMTPTERNVLLKVKDSLKKHLALMLSAPENYLASFKFAMDFVWAKCAFSFLLLLKLNRLLPESQEYDTHLLGQGYQLIAELRSIGTSGGSSASKSYFQLLNSSIEKYGRVVAAHEKDTTSPSSARSNVAELVSNEHIEDSQDAQTDLDSFIPEQFIFEWDFPGLTLFSSPASWDNFFDEFLLGGGGGDDALFTFVS